MTFSTNLEKMGILKRSLLVIKPRRQIAAASWTSLGSNLYSAPFAFGRIAQMWITRDSGAIPRFTTLASLTSGGFFHDLTAGVVYVYAVVAPDARTVEYELHLADEPWNGPADPLDATSEVVYWEPALDKDPTASSGSRDTQFGFSPLSAQNVILDNADGWLNSHLHESSFIMARVKGYALATEHTDLARAMAAGDVHATFTGFVGKNITGLAQVSVPIVDFFQLLDQKVAPMQFVSTNFTGYTIDPAACIPYSEWYVRRIRGMVGGLVPVNVDYNATPSTTTNRDWVTHEDDLQDAEVGTLTMAINSAGGCDATHTAFTSKPKCNVGDWILINRSGTLYPRQVQAVNRTTKIVTHAAIGVAQDAGRDATRMYISNVYIEVNGVTLNLQPIRDFVPLDLTPIRAFGFTLTDNFEANWAGNFGADPFDPASHPISCRVYGRDVPEKYSDATTNVGAVTDEGGVDSSAVGLLYRLLRSGGIQASEIDETSFQAVGGARTDSLGIAIPAVASEQPGTFKDLITEVLQSMLWRLTWVQSGSDIKIGLVEISPMSAADYTADETQGRLTDFEQDYADIYDTTKVRYGILERLNTGDLDTFAGGVSTLAYELHFIRREFSMDTLHYVLSEAQTLANRLAFMLGDRRAFYTVELEQAFLERADTGKRYDLTRQQLPGYDFVEGTQRTRRMRVVEMQKSMAGVTLTLEDQKGIENNTGGW